MAVFIDKDKQDFFEKNGYVVIDLLTIDEVDRLTSLYNAYFPSNNESFYINIYDNDFLKRKHVSEKTKEIIEKHASKLFNGYKFIVSVFALKKSKVDQRFDVHQDITITDENVYQSISIWCPLQDVDCNNGALQVMPGSHKIPSTPRGYNVPSRIDNIKEHIWNNYMTTLVMKKGQAVIWDHKLVHGSGPNTTTSDRVASVSLLIPQNAPTLLYYTDVQPEDDKVADVTIYKITEGSYDYYDVREKPSTEVAVKYRDEQIHIKALTTEELDEFVQRETVSI